jgi:hypothetical protein
MYTKFPLRALRNRSAALPYALYSSCVGALLPTGGNVTLQRMADDVALTKASRGSSES